MKRAAVLACMTTNSRGHALAKALQTVAAVATLRASCGYCAIELDRLLVSRTRLDEAMRAQAKLFGVLLIVAIAADVSSRPLSAPGQSWGSSESGLRLGISSEASGAMRPTGREFMVSFQNAGDSDFVLNLGFMLANGKVMFPSAVQLILTDPAGKRRELETAGARVGGRMDDFTVALRTGSTYTLRLALAQYWSPSTKETQLKLTNGRHRISARFEGHGARSVALDMQGVALLNFWKGTVESNTVEFDVSGQVR
jgi:hypothetical protein